MIIVIINKCSEGLLSQYLTNLSFSTKNIRFISCTYDDVLLCRRLFISSEFIDCLLPEDTVESILYTAKKNSTNWINFVENILNEELLANDLHNQLKDVLELHCYSLLCELLRSIRLSQKHLTDTEGIVFLGDSDISMKGNFNFWSGFQINYSLISLRQLAVFSNIPFTYYSNKKIVNPRSFLRKIKYVLRAFNNKAKIVIKSILSNILCFCFQKNKPVKKNFFEANSEKNKKIIVYAENRHFFDVRPIIIELLSKNWQTHLIVESVDDKIITKIQEITDLFGTKYWSWNEIKQEDYVLKNRDSIFKKGISNREIQDALTDAINDSMSCIHPVSRALFHDYATWLLEFGFKEVVLRLIKNSFFLEQHSPDIFMSPVDTSCNDISWVLSANKLGIQTCTPLHGSIWTSKKQSLYPTPLSKRQYVYDKYSKDFYVESHGYNPDDIVCVGYPKFQERFSDFKKTQSQSFQIRENYFSKYPQIKNGYKILVLTSCIDGYSQLFNIPIFEIYESFIKIIDNLSQRLQVPCHGIFRTHPASSFKTEQIITQEYGVIFEQNMSLAELANICDLVISQPTTASFEMMLFRKPVLFLSYSISNLMRGYITSHNLTSALNENHALVLLERLLTDNIFLQTVLEKQNHVISEMCNTNQNCSTQIVLDLEQLILKN
jgi:hypothetical protein